MSNKVNSKADDKTISSFFTYPPTQKNSKMSRREAFYNSQQKLEFLQDVSIAAGYNAIIKSLFRRISQTEQILNEDICNMNIDCLKLALSNALPNSYIEGERMLLMITKYIDWCVTKRYTSHNYAKLLMVDDIDFTKGILLRNVGHPNTIAKYFATNELGYNKYMNGLIGVYACCEFFNIDFLSITPVKVEDINYSVNMIAVNGVVTPLHPVFFALFKQMQEAMSQIEVGDSPKSCHALLSKSTPYLFQNQWSLPSGVYNKRRPTNFIDDKRLRELKKTIHPYLNALAYSKGEDYPRELEDYRYSGEMYRIHQKVLEGYTPEQAVAQQTNVTKRYSFLRVKCYHKFAEVFWS